MVTPRSTDDLALVGLLLAGDHAEQRGLAGAVRPDQADLLALLERRGGLDEEDLVAVLLADVVETDHEVILGKEIVAAVSSRSGALTEACSGLSPNKAAGTTPAASA